jgi:hypothetical protein
VEPANPVGLPTQGSSPESARSAASRPPSPPFGVSTRAGPPPSRLRQVAMIVGFDLAAPLSAYALLRSAGMSPVSALLISGVFPAVGIGTGALVDRRLDIIGVVVLVGIAFGTVVGLISHSARLFLLEGSVPSLVFALACLASLRTRHPLIYRFAVELLGPDTPKGRDVTSAWRYPGFRRAFQVITVAWGIGYLVEVAVRIVLVETVSTGIALVGSKLVPYAFGLVLGIWTLVYGEYEKKKAERLHAAVAATSEASSAPLCNRPPCTLVRCAAR